MIDRDDLRDLQEQITDLQYELQRSKVLHEELVELLKDLFFNNANTEAWAFKLLTARDEGRV